MIIDLSGQTAVITGGARGIGLAMARALAADGAISPCLTCSTRSRRSPRRSLWTTACRPMAESWT